MEKFSLKNNAHTFIKIAEYTNLYVQQAREYLVRDNVLSVFVTLKYIRK